MMEDCGRRKSWRRTPVSSLGWEGCTAPDLLLSPTSQAWSGAGAPTRRHRAPPLPFPRARPGPPPPPRLEDVSRARTRGLDGTGRARPARLPRPGGKEVLRLVCQGLALLFFKL